MSRSAPGEFAGASEVATIRSMKLAFGFRYTKGDFGTRIEGYIVAEGRLAIWIIEVSARIYLGIISENSSCEGMCTVTYSVKLGFFKKSFSGTFHKQISGAATNHQEQARKNYALNQESARSLNLHLNTGANRHLAGVSRITAAMSRVSQTEFKEAYFNRKITNDAQETVTQTYHVTRKDWDDYFDRLN